MVNNLPEMRENPGLTPGSGRSPGGRHGNPLQYSCLENPMDRGAWRAAVHGVCKELDTTETLTFMYVLPIFKKERKKVKNH